MTEVTIRAFEITDWEDVAEVFLAPHCRWGTLQMPYQSRNIRQKLENPPPGMHRLVAVLDNRAIGIASLHSQKYRRAHVGGVGIMVHDDYQHRGAGSQLLEAIIELAENWLNLSRIELNVYTDNASAIHLYKKYGFVIEGTLRQYAFRNGDYVDAYAMARVRE